MGQGLQLILSALGWGHWQMVCSAGQCKRCALVCPVVVVYCDQIPLFPMLSLAHLPRPTKHTSTQCTHTHTHTHTQTKTHTRTHTRQTQIPDPFLSPNVVLQIMAFSCYSIIRLTKLSLNSLLFSSRTDHSRTLYITSTTDYIFLLLHSIILFSFFPLFSFCPFCR